LASAAIARSPNGLRVALAAGADTATVIAALKKVDNDAEFHHQQ
jgi:hypothetical protein